MYMGKLMDRLQQQLKTEHKQDAENCLKIYNKLKEMHNGHVWQSHWGPLVNVEFLGTYPYRRRYYPTAMGDIFINGIKT